MTSAQPTAVADSAAEEPLLGPNASKESSTLAEVAVEMRIQEPERNQSVAVEGGSSTCTNMQGMVREEGRIGTAIGSGNKNRTRIAGILWMNNSRLLCLIMALDLMTMSVLVPSLPSVFESHGMDLRWQGWVASVYCVISFFVSPMLGRASDSVGRVSMLKLSAVGSMLGALGSLYARNKWAFIAARTLPGFMKCSLPISQAYIVDVSHGSAERSKNLGMLGASFGMAFVLGPPLGGKAADYDIRLPFVISVLEGALLIFALQLLPEPRPQRKKSDREHGDGPVAASAAGDRDDEGDGVVVAPGLAPASAPGMKRNRSYLLIAAAAENGRAKALAAAAGGGGGKGLGDAAGVGTASNARPKSIALGTQGMDRMALLRGPGGKQISWGFHDRFFLVVAETLYHTSFAPFLTKVLGFPAGTIGELLSFMGAVSALTNAFLVGILTERLGEKPLMAVALLVLAAGWLMWSVVSGSVPSMLASMSMVGVGGNLFQTVNKAAVAHHAPPEMVGTVMGMSGALETFGRSIAGPLSGYLFNAWGARGIPITCACAAAYVSIALAVRGFAHDVKRK